MAQRGYEVTALGISERPKMEGIHYVRYMPNRGSSKGIHPWAVDFETKLIRAEACLRAAETLAKTGYKPDLICAHPGWGEALFLKELWPEVPQLHYLEFFYRSEGQDVGFDPEFSQPDIDSRARLVAKNANNLLSLESMDAGICPTVWQYSTLPSSYQNKIKVIHDGIDTVNLQPNANAQIILKDEDGQVIHLKAGEAIVTYVARNLEPFRGYHQFMRALPQILKERPDAKIVIIGGDDVSYGARPEQGSWKLKFLNEVREQLDLQRVHFVGLQPYSNFIQILQCSRVHVYLTYPFVLSWSLLEAMSIGANVVASDTQPVREVIRHGKNGWLVDFFSPNAIAQQVIQCLAENTVHHAIRSAARKTVVERYDLQSQCLPAQVDWIEQWLNKTRD